MRFRNFHSDRLSQAQNVDDIDLEISSFWLDEAYTVSENVRRTKKSRSLNSNNIIDIIPMPPTK